MRQALRLSLLLLFLGTPAASAAAKDYSAVRFDSTVRVQRDGKLEVTETIAFRFDSGTFEHVVREIPLRRTDGIDVVRAEMDGRHLRFGDGVGQAEVEHKSRVTVRWRFAPVSDSTHTFLLTYVVSGAVRKEKGADILEWRATPGEHPYAIEAAAIDFQLPVPPLASPSLDLRRVGSSEVQNDGTHVRISARDIRPDGWIEATFRFPEGSILASAPEWQERRLRQAAVGPTWLMAGAGIVGLGLIVLFGMRQNYDSPPPDESSTHADGTHLARPDTLAPAIAGAIVANGKPALEHAMAVVFSLADHGELAIDEQPRGAFRQRNFAITRRSTTRPLTRYEQVVLDTIFPPDSPSVITLSKARTQLVRRFSAFSAEIKRELMAAGLLDEGRQAVRRRYHFTGAALMIAGAISVMVILIAFLLQEHGGWPMVVPAALTITGLAALIFGAATTPLSNDGVRRARHWRAYQNSLKSVARGRAEMPNEADVLPLAVALGLAAVWSQYLKQRQAAAPSWFHALTASTDDGMAFPAFLASGGAGSTGDGGSTGGASSGGAAGGGSSSAG